MKILGRAIKLGEIERTWKNQCYSRVHISSDEVVSKILKKPSIVQKKMIPQKTVKNGVKNKKIF